MKPRNPIYLGDHNLEPPEDNPQIACTYCRVAYSSRTWRDHRGKCPNCHKPYAGKANED